MNRRHVDAALLAVTAVFAADGIYAAATSAGNGTQQAIDYPLGVLFNLAVVTQFWCNWRVGPDDERTRGWSVISWSLGLVWCLFDYLCSAVAHRPDWVDLLLAGLFAVFLFTGGRRNRDAAKRLIGAKSQALLDKLRHSGTVQGHTPAAGR